MAHPPLWQGWAGLGFPSSSCAGGLLGEVEWLQPSEGLPATLASGALPVCTPKLESVVSSEQPGQASCHRSLHGAGQSLALGSGFWVLPDTTYDLAGASFLGPRAFPCDRDTGAT